MNIKPIAYFQSPFPGKFGVPRQAGLAPAVKGRIVFEPGFRNPDALRGLDGFDYIWLIWEFNGNRKEAGAASLDGETHATLGTVRGGTGAERSEASGGASRSEAVEPPELASEALSSQGKSPVQR